MSTLVLRCLFFSHAQLEEKARLEAEARAREHLHLREEQRREEEEELERLQELQKLRAVKKKKKERPSKDCPKLDMLARSFQAATESLPSSENIHNGSLEPVQDPDTSSRSPSRHADHTEPGPGRGPGADGDASDPADARDSKLLLPKGVGGKQQEPLSFLLNVMHQHREGNGKQKLKPASKACSEPARKPVEPPRASEAPARPRPQPQPQAEPKARVLDLTPLAEHRREDRKANSNNNNRKPLNHVREEKSSPGPAEPAPAEQPPSSKPVPADSPQPKGKARKSKKKKGDRASSSIGKYGAGRGGARPAVWGAPGPCLWSPQAWGRGRPPRGLCFLWPPPAPLEGHAALVAVFGCSGVISDFLKPCKREHERGAHVPAPALSLRAAFLGRVRVASVGAFDLHRPGGRLLKTRPLLPNAGPVGSGAQAVLGRRRPQGVSPPTPQSPDSPSAL